MNTAVAAVVTAPPTPSAPLDGVGTRRETLFTRAWTRVRGAVTVGLFVVATGLGVTIGLGGVDVSPVAPGAAFTAAAPVDPLGAVGLGVQPAPGQDGGPAVVDGGGGDGARAGALGLGGRDVGGGGRSNRRGGGSGR